MRRGVVLLVSMTMAPGALAQTSPAAPAEDDDPAFARQPPAPPPASASDEEPVPDPVPYTEEDPGFSPAPSAPATALHTGAPRRAPDADEEIGIGVRFAYRTVAIPEPSAPPAGGVEPPFQDDRFHGLCLDVYPIAWYARVGLSTQIAFEPRQNDWLATEGLIVGLQKPAGRWTPFVEAGAHVGLMRRTFYLADERVPALDSPTLLWAFHGEVGVDARLTGGSAAASVSIGLQRTSFFYTTGQDADNLLVKNDTALSLKVGLGY